MKRITTGFFLLLITLFFTNTVFSQWKSKPITSPLRGDGDRVRIDGSQLNAITTAVPFLMIAPDSRSGAMGDVGVATSPDANSMHWNPAKYAFIEKDMGIAVSYTPWLRELIGDISLSYISGYKRISDNQTIGASLLYFSLGNITFTDIQGGVIRDYTPHEFAIDGAYSFLLGENLSGGISLRYIYSTLTGQMTIDGTDTHPGHAVSSDLSLFYRRKYKVSGKKHKLALGMNISNIGSKISYSDDATKEFIPINLRLGGAYTIDIDDYNKITFAVDGNKLLVPTPPERNLQNEIVAGKDNDVPVAKGIFQSFGDAPGYESNGEFGPVYQEELNEVNLSVGAEYWYSEQFAIRSGYFYEHETKGNRKYFTMGIGLRLNVFGLDFSYLIPTTQHNPLENTLRFSLTFDFEGLKEQGETE